MITLAELSRLTSKVAIERLVEERYQGDIGKLLADISSSLNQLLQTDLKQATRFVERAERCFACLPKNYRPRYLILQARLAHWRGNSKEALRKYILAIRQLEKNGEHLLAAQTRQGLMDAYMYLGMHEKALATGKEALRFFRRKHQEISAARVMTNIGNIYHRLDRNREALRYYDRARETFAGQGGVPLAIVDFNRANILVNFNRLDEAEILYRTAAEIYRSNGMAIAEAKATYSLAYVYFLRDQYSAALKTFDAALEAFKKLGDAKAVAVTTLDLAEINTYLNQLGSTVMLSGEAINACRKLGLHYEEAKAAYFGAEALRCFGDYNEARRHLTHSERLFAREGNKLWLGMVGLERARLSLDHGRFLEAAQTAVEAQRLFKSSGDERRMLDAEIAVVQARLSGEDEDNVSSEAKAEQLLKRPLSSHQEYTLCHLLGQHQLKNSHPAAALRHFQRAIGVAERILPNLRAGEGQYFFALSKSSSYAAAVECLLETGNLDKSFAQNSRALSVLNQKRELVSTLTSEVPDKMLRTRDSLRAALKKLNRPPDSETRSSSAPSFRRLEHQLYTQNRKIVSLISGSTPDNLSLVGETEPCLGMLAADEILLNPVALRDAIGVFCVSVGKTEFVRCAVTPQTFETAVRELHFLMENAVYMPARASREAIVGHLRQIQDWLINPLALQLRGRKPILLVDGVFAQVPYCALCDHDGRFLHEKSDFSVIVNPNDLTARSAEIRSDQISNSSIFAVTSSELRMVAEEGRRISLQFPQARVHIDEDATSSVLQRELCESDGFVHIATHASRSSENPLFSRILLRDGPFFPFDLFASGVRAQLVTLSGCQTAAPGIHYANSFSLAKAFYQAGARFVLASLWPVSDKLSMVFMSEFYHALSEKADIRAAYRAALGKVQSICDNPALWAPYVLLGM